MKIQVDDFVYEPYNPNNPGKVVSIEDDPDFSNQNYCTVKFLNGRTKKVSSNHLKDFNKLIEDHKRKLGTHISKLKAIGDL